MSDLVLNSVTSGYNLSLINTNFQAIANRINDYTLQNKEGKNVLNQDLDMNGHGILNMNTDFSNNGSMLTVGDAKSHFYQVGLVPSATGDTDAVNLGQVSQMIEAASVGTNPANVALYSELAADAGAGLIGSSTGETVEVRLNKADALKTDLSDATGSSLVGFQTSGTGTVASDVETKLGERLSLLDFIPKAEHDAIRAWTSTYDCTAALQAAIYEAQNRRAMLYIPSGTYQINNTIDAFPAASYGIQGDGPNNTRLAFTINDASKVGFKLTNGTDPSVRGKEYVLRDLAFITTGGVTPGPVLLEHRYMTDAKWINLTFSHYQDNSAILISDVWNSDFYAVSVWGAGHQKPLRAISSGVTASIASGSNALTTSSSIFVSGDVGKYIIVSGPVQHVFQITGFTSGTSVTVSPSARSTISGEQIDFAGVTCFTTAGSTTVTLNAPVLTSADVGRFVCVIGAGSTAAGTGQNSLRGWITAVNNASSMELSVAAGSAVSGGFITFSPAVVITNDNGGTNDADFKGLHIEEHRGVGLLVDSGLNMTFNSLKCHSTPTNKGGANGKTSAASAVFIGASAYVDGDFEQRVGNPYGRIIVSHCAHGGLNFANISTVATYGMPIIYTRDGKYWGKVSVGTVACQNQADEKYQREWYGTDGSNNGVHHYGTFSSLQAITHTPGGTAQFGAIKSCGTRPVVQLNPGEAASFSLPSDTKCGALLLFSNNNDIGLTCLVGYSYVNGTPQCQIIAQPAGGVFASATGALAGQTGTSGKITVSVDSNGVFYVENRASSFRQFWLVNFS